ANRSSLPAGSKLSFGDVMIYVILNRSQSSRIAPLPDDRRHRRLFGHAEQSTGFSRGCRAPGKLRSSLLR
ncbi:hypothetical protein, partial [Burkholderia ubonensis]|uniref:hypothetical protein n=1 Tax=Burkholderia ubonensis TaxID=101571 RepID=UPI001E5C12E3